jgi:hypothetical protein
LIPKSILRPGTVVLAHWPKWPARPMPAGLAKHVHGRSPRVVANDDPGDELLQLRWHMNEHQEDDVPGKKMRAVEKRAAWRHSSMAAALR